jgi:glycosyltransferase involved in cell wall biosynthesis
LRTDYPKILFLDSTLHNNNGTGITLTNLFLNWPKESLFMLADKSVGELEHNCLDANLFILTNEEHDHKFPFNMFKKRITENDVKIGIEKKIARTGKSLGKGSDRTKIIAILKNKLLSLYSKMGLEYYFLRLKLSDKLNNWIEEIKPDYLYVLLSNRHSIIFAENVYHKYHIPIIIHIMDDWPATIGKTTLFPSFWNKKINSDFKRLLSYSYKRIAISQKMAIEYESRFGGDWLFFHNPAEMNRPSAQRVDSEKLKNKIKVGYFGGIGNANKATIDFFIEFMNQFPNLNLELHIFSKEKSLETVFTIYHGYIAPDQIRGFMSSCDYLLLPLSFEAELLDFEKYSMPTKLSEYLASGVPVIVIAPPAIAVTEFVQLNKCAYLIDNLDIEVFNKMFLDIYNANHKEELEMLEKAKSVALENFSMQVVHKRFESIFK